MYIKYKKETAWIPFSVDISKSEYFEQVLAKFGLYLKKKITFCDSQVLWFEKWYYSLCRQHFQNNIKI